MSEWKSRIDIDPPAQFFADALAYLSLAFPGARLDREMVRELRPYLVHQWRLGQNGAKAAAATCSCDGVKIVPSPASQIEIPKRSALAPKGAQRTDVFGVEDLREPGMLPKLRVQAEIARRQYEHFEQERAALQAQASGAAPSGRGSKRVAAMLARTEQNVATWAEKARQAREKVESLVASVPWSRGADAAIPGEVPAARAKSARGTSRRTAARPKKKASPKTAKAPAAQARPLVLSPFLSRSTSTVKWSFTGAPDVRLLFVRKDGRPLSVADSVQLREAQNPSLLPEFASRYYGSQAEAEAAAQAVGQPITQLFIPSDIAPLLAKPPEASAPPAARPATPAPTPGNKRGRSKKAATACTTCSSAPTPEASPGPSAAEIEALLTEFAASAAEDLEKAKR